MKTAENNKKKRYIEDSADVREAIADLQTRASEEGKKKIVLREEPSEDDSFSDGVDTLDHQAEAEETLSGEDAWEEVYVEEYTEDSSEDYYEEAYMEERDTVSFKGVKEALEEEYAQEGADADFPEEDGEEASEESYGEPEITAPVRKSRKKQPEAEAEEQPRAKKTEKKRPRRSKKKKEEDDTIISLEGVTKSYVKGIPALNDVNIKIKKGEFVFIVGDSGSGKSTLIKLLLRELKPTEGSIWVNGFQVDRLRHGKIPKLRRSMGVVFQDFRLLPDMNVYENVAFAQRIVQTPVRQMKRNVPNMLAMVGLAGKYKAKPNELSGGEQQRVALARALVNQPPILLADEPTGNLDVKNTNEIMSLLEKINENGTTVIVVTHNDKIVNDMKKRVITIKKGVIVSDEEKGGYIYED